MKAPVHYLVFFLLVVPMASSSCGNPEVSLPDALSVVFMPLDGAIDVEPDVPIEIYFSGDVAPDSVTKDTVFLESATFDGTSCGQWQTVDFFPRVSDVDPRVVIIGSDSDELELDTCYRITCTTGVRGVELGALVDLGLAAKKDGRKGIGAEAVFRTRSRS